MMGLKKESQAKNMSSSTKSDEYLERFEPQVINQFQYLPPGDYVLEITAINALGMQGEATHMDITMPVLPKNTAVLKQENSHKTDSREKMVYQSPMKSEGTDISEMLAVASVRFHTHFKIENKR